MENKYSKEEIQKEIDDLLTIIENGKMEIENYCSFIKEKFLLTSTNN